VRKYVSLLWPDLCSGMVDLEAHLQFGNTQSRDRHGATRPSATEKADFLGQRELSDGFLNVNCHGDLIDRRERPPIFRSLSVPK
jgi:hypothetical protein